MRNYAVIRNMIIFDPAEVWQHLDQYNKDYFDFLESKGLEGQVVKAVGGAVSENVILISKKPMLPGVDIKPEIKSVKPTIDALRNIPPSKAAQDFKKGKYNFKKGVLVK
jgi:hypothetical protein